MLIYMMRLNIKARLQYGRTFVYEALSHIFAFYLFEFLAVWILLNKFSNVGGWSFFQILFLQALAYFIRAVAASIFWDPMIQMSNYVRDGRIDRFLVAPINSFYYIVGTNFGVWTFSHIAVGIVGTVIAGAFLNIQWTFLGITFLIIGVLAGMLIYSSLIILGGAMSFWTVRSQGFLWILLDSMPLINYPITIYPKALQSILTFVVPIALINYFPTSYILGKGDVNLLMMTVILAASIALMWLAYRFWWFGAKKYSGTGS